MPAGRSRRAQRFPVTGTGNEPAARRASMRRRRCVAQPRAIGKLIVGQIRYHVPIGYAALQPSSRLAAGHGFGNCLSKGERDNDFFQAHIAEKRGRAGRGFAAARPCRQTAWRPDRFGPTWESLTAQYQAPDWFRDAKFGIGRTGPRSACRKPATGMPATCICRARSSIDHHLEELRPSRRHRLHGDEQSLEGRELAPRRTDRPLRQGGRALFRLPGQPSRQFRQLRLALP